MAALTHTHTHTHPPTVGPHTSLLSPLQILLDTWPGKLLPIYLKHCRPVLARATQRSGAAATAAADGVASSASGAATPSSNSSSGPHPHLFLTGSGQPYTSSNWGTWWAEFQVAHDMPLPHMPWHAMRHVWATHMLSNPDQFPPEFVEAAAHLMNSSGKTLKARYAPNVRHASIAAAGKAMPGKRQKILSMAQQQSIKEVPMLLGDEEGEWI